MQHSNTPHHRDLLLASAISALLLILSIIAICAALLLTSTQAVASDLGKPATGMVSLNATTPEADTLFFMLPDDADKKNYKRQLKAIKKGLYWTAANTLKPLDDDHELKSLKPQSR